LDFLLSNIYLLSSSLYDDVISVPLLDIEYLNIQVEIEDCDSIIFTSKNAVLAIDRLNSKWKKLKSFCVGDATAKLVKELGGNVEIIANGYGDDLIKKILTYNKNKFCYIRGENISTDIKSNTIDSIIIKDYILYKTKCKKIDIEFPNNSIFIFTSPLIVKCFFNQVQWNNSFKAISIGHKTSNKFPAHVITSEYQTIENCISIAKTLI